MTSSQIYSYLKSLKKDFGEIYIVGGAIRDILTGKGLSRDIDILCKKPKELSIALKKLTGGFSFDLGKEWNIWRVMTKEGTTIDVSSPFPNLNQNLIERDFSVNAIALKIEENEEEIKLIDPAYGIHDITNRILRTPDENNLKKDPIRLLRFYRFKSTLNFREDEITRIWVIKNSHLISESPPERITYELYKLLNGENWSENLFEAFEVLFVHIHPDLESIFTFRKVPLREHVFSTLEQLNKVLNDLGTYFPESSPEGGKVLKQLQEFLEEPLAADRKRESSMKLAALLHDWGKPFTYEEKKLNGRKEISFIKHDEVGAEKTLNLAERLKLSSREKEFLYNTVRWHMRIGALAKTYNITKRALYKIFRDMGSDAVATAIISLADWKATYRGAFPMEVMSFHRHTVREIIRSYFQEREIVVKPKPIIRGNELVELVGRKPGPWIKETLEELLELQVEGKVKTRKEALRWVKEKFSLP